MSGFAGRFVPGRLWLAGEPVPPPAVVCRFAGRLDEPAALAADLGLPASAPEELLRSGFERWGPALVDRLRGEFALLIWDAGRRRGMLARDPLGIQPLFLREEGGEVRFATELRTLVAALPRRPAPDRASVAQHLAAGSRADLATLYEGVRRLGPGEMLALGEAGARRRRWWRPRYEEPLAGGEELTSRVRAALELAVRRRLDPDAATGVLLSGGLDSSAVAALAASRAPLRAYSGSFPEHPEADEGELIAELRARLGVDGPLAEVRPGGLLASALAHQAALGTPLLGWGDFWIEPLLRAAAAEGVTAMLDGDGGDELFGPRGNLVADELRRGRLRTARRTLERLPGGGPGLPRRVLYRALAEQAVTALPRQLLRPVSRRRSAAELPAWFQQRTRADVLASADPLAWRELDGPLWWAQIAHGVGEGMEAAGFFEHAAGRAALTGVEPRHPLLDLDLVELCLRQPPAATLDPRFNRPVFRAALAGALPDSVRLRPQKARFQGLIADSLLGPDWESVRGLLTGPEARLREYVDAERMRAELLDGGAVERRSFRWMWLVWRALTMELWLRAEAGSEPLAEAPQTASVKVFDGRTSPFFHLDTRTVSNTLDARD